MTALPRRPLLPLAALLGLGLLPHGSKPAARAKSVPGHLTSRPLPSRPKVKFARLGEEITTSAGQRRRLVLPGGSVLYVNQKTTVKLEGEGKVTLADGEIFVEAAAADDDAAPFVVRTPKRRVSGRAARFAVGASAAGTGVVVARGKVAVSGLKRLLPSGSQLPAGSTRAVPAPRLSHLLHWTRDLMVAAEPRLVPDSRHSGGALVVRDPDGQEASLSLRKYHVDVHIEDGFARTTIDQTYFNQAHTRLEGTFYFPLPADASLSRLAMYVNSNLMEGGMTERDYARRVYETIRYRQQDPALLEWVDGSTFKMRVFPLEPRQEKRIILSYTQRLESLYGQAKYRFPAGHSLGAVKDWSFHARVKGGADWNWSSASHTLKAGKNDGDLLLDGMAKNARFDRDVVLNLTGDKRPGEEVRFTAMAQDGARYLMLRYRPELKSAARRHRRDWVFLFESSGDRNPLLARVQIEVIRHLLEQAEPDDTFTVLASGTRVHAFAKEPRPVSPANIKEAVAFLERVHLIGALDLGRALTEAAPILKKTRAPHLVHVGSGIPALGERRQDVLVKRLPVGTRYVGVGVGRRWGRAFMKAAAEKTGGYFTQINPDEPVGWRSFELAATLNTPRLLNLQVMDKDAWATFLPFTSSVAQGEVLGAIARIGSRKQTLPKSVVVTGSLNGKAFERVLPVRDVAGEAGYLPRTWAQLEIERLLAQDARKHKKQIVALSKAMYVMTPFTSLLVLENEDMYTQFKVDRGRQDHWAPYPLPKKIQVVTEDDQVAARKGRKPAAQVLNTILVRDPTRLLSRSIPSPEENRPAIEWAPRVLRPGKVQLEVQRLRLVREVNDVDGSITAAPRRFLEGRAGKGAGKGKKDFLDSAMDDAATFGPRIQAQTAVNAARERAGRPLQDSNIAQSRLNPGDENDDGNGNGEAGITNKLRKIRQREAIKALEPNRARRWGMSGSLKERGKGIGRGSSLLYQRPGYSGDDRLFYDLLAYAPGLNTGRADILAVLEAEALPDPRSKPGRIDAAARRLLARARVRGWQSLTIPASARRKGYTILFNDQGRYAYERALPHGLSERVVCDGETLLHLYPDLGLAARRRVSRFHRAAFAARVPWAVPRAEDLAHGRDVLRIADNTIALVPQGAASRKTADGKPAPYYQLHLVFGGNGRLAEWQIVLMPAKKILYRETYSADGVVKLLDGKGKELAVRPGKLAKAEAPNLKPDTRKLVVLPLPYRTREHILQVRQLQKTNYQDMRFKDALALLAADVAAGNANAAQAVFQKALHAREQRQLGLYVLLAACGLNLDADHLDVMAEHEEAPLAQNLALHSSPVLRRHASQWAVGSRQWQAAGFVQHLAVSHALFQRWGDAKVVKGSPAKVKAERARAVKYVRANKGTVFGWVLLCLMEDRAGKDRAFHRELSELWPLFRDVPGLGYAARYEQARCLWKAGQKQDAQKHFRELYEKTVKENRLPPIDPDFRQALLGDGKGDDPWSELIGRTASRLVKQKQRFAVLALAWQCWQLDDLPLANHLLRTALEGAPKGKERLSLTLATLGFLWETGQLDRVDQVLRKLLADPKLARRALLWRLGVKLAEERDQKARALECLERALEADYQNPPQVIDLRRVRKDYGKLLEHYQSLADAMVTLQVKPPPDFRAKVIRAADRWRALDREDGVQSCPRAGRIFQTLGDRELSWDYLTTPIALKPNEAAPLLGLAQTLARRGELDLADRAYRGAFEAEPTNAQILWDRARNLRAAGKTVAARAVLRRLADGKWQPRFQNLQAQARWQLKEP
jgi:Tfp pilus assembly protein PilF